MLADALLDTAKLSLAAVTVPFTTALMVMDVLPTVPLCGDEVTSSVIPLTLPVAGRSAAEVDAVADPAFVVVVELVDELEQPAITGLARASRAMGKKRRRCIGQV